jgi:hypothetical protein
MTESMDFFLTHLKNPFDVIEPYHCPVVTWGQICRFTQLTTVVVSQNKRRLADRNLSPSNTQGLFFGSFYTNTIFQAGPVSGNNHRITFLQTFNDLGIVPV